MPAIYVKGIPETENLGARYALAQQYNISGVEVLLSPYRLEQEEHRIVDALRVGAGNFEGSLNIEISPFFERLEDRHVDFDLFSTQPGIRDRSRKTLDKVIEIHKQLQLQGVISFHPVYNNHRDYPGEEPYEIKRNMQAAKEFGGYIRQKTKETGVTILVENTFPHLKRDGRGYRITYSEIGMFLEDFTEDAMNLPMTFDTAHLGILMRFCETANEDGIAEIPGTNLKLKIPESYKPPSLKDKNYTEALRKTIETFRTKLDVRNVHWVNAGPMFTGEADHCTSITDRIGLFNLRQALNAILAFNPDYIVPEVDEDDYIQMPHTRKLLDIMKKEQIL